MSEDRILEWLILLGIALSINGWFAKRRRQRREAIEREQAEYDAEIDRELEHIEELGNAAMQAKAEPEPITSGIIPDYEHRVLSHVLLWGLAGAGKTTLAKVIKNELQTIYGHGIGFTWLTPKALNGREHRTLDRVIETLNYGDVVFIDEIHALDRDIEEALYSVMQEFVYAYVGYTGAEQLDVPAFTLIGATTLPGDISHPLRRRFPLLFELEPMDENVLARIIQDRAVKNGDPRNLNEYRGQESVKKLLKLHFKALQGPELVRSITDDASSFLANRSAHSPATSVQMYEHAKVIAQTQGHTCITLRDAEATVEALGVDHNGLYKSDRRVIQVLLDRDNLPMGERALATALGVSSTGLREMIEPRLVRLGLLELTSRGRKLTERAINEYGQKTS